jgi:hypothetical protein
LGGIFLGILRIANTRNTGKAKKAISVILIAGEHTELQESTAADAVLLEKFRGNFFFKKMSRKFSIEYTLDYT